MTLTAGTKLGPYEILAPLGAGGMGEVYRARDTRLSREVAVKVLPQHLSANPEVRTRFEREAKTVSSLNHPNICTLFDVGREGETDYLVMELVDGETLAARIAKGPIPMEQILNLGIQISNALDRAHRAGVVHRDLKPGNVMITKGVAKLMDFGLARATGLGGPGTGSSVSMAALTTSPTMAQPLTAEGTIVGTFQYMSPEQMEGQEADARGDVWALGCVLYEMATGKPAFTGKSQASLIGAIMHSDPTPLSQLAPLTPPSLEKLVKGCLTKDPDQRIQTAHDVELQLSWIRDGGSQSGAAAPVAARHSSGGRLAWGIASLALFAAAALGVLYWTKASKPPQVIRFETGVPTSLVPQGPVRVSPNGTALAMAATDSAGITRLWMRPFDDLEWRALPGTEGSGRPFWSPDSRHLGFFVDGKLKKIQVTGGRPETICEAPGGSDGTWSPGGMILYDGDGAHPRIQFVPSTGGTPHDAVTLDTARGDVEADWPTALPDGKHFLYAAQNRQSEKSHIYFGEIGGKKWVSVLPGTGRVEYSAPGLLLFERDHALLAQRFDQGTGKLQGEPHTLTDQVALNSGNSMAYFSCSLNGVLAFSQTGSATRRIVWLDRSGNVSGEILGAGSYGSLALSPDGKYLAYEQTDASGAASDLWIRDLQRGISSRLTTDPANDIWPAWTPDSKSLYWASNRAGTFAIYRRALESTGADSLVFKDKGNVGPNAISPDGKFVVYTLVGGASGSDILALPLGGGSPIPVAATRFTEVRPQLSPNGKWVSYESDQSGKRQIYVQPFPGGGAPVQVSNQGGVDARWSPDGAHLYYRSTTGLLMGVEVKTGGRFDAGAPQPLFSLQVGSGTLVLDRYGAAPDGQRFVANLPQNSASAWKAVVVFGWPQELKK